MSGIQKIQNYIDSLSIKYSSYPGWDDSQTATMACIASNVNDAMGLSEGMDKNYKSFDIEEDYANGGNCRFFTYNSPGKVSWMSVG